MIGVSKLLCGTDNYGDRLRYVKGASSQKNGVSNSHGPVVVWNCTRTCNLKCRHCYADSDSKAYEGELTTEEGKKLIEDLAEFRVPVILFSGGEPLARKDIFELIEYADKCGIRSTLSTNGTLIDKETVNMFKRYNVGYVGVSLDGIGSRHDDFRQVKGSFDKALDAIRYCREQNQRVGLRFTINRNNYDQIGDIFRLIKEENIDRVCFYHLAYSGRGSEMMKEDITHEESRRVMDIIMEKAIELKDNTEILTVDNHADIVYLYMRVKEKYPELSERVIELMRMNGGNRSGIAFGNIDNRGYVHADQFTQHHSFGNIRERSFKDIWTDESTPILGQLKDRKGLLKGRCSKCKWIDVCNGNFRSRAEAAVGDFWASDPACYLTNEEIGVPLNMGLI